MAAILRQAAAFPPSTPLVPDSSPSTASSSLAFPSRSRTSLPSPSLTLAFHPFVTLQSLRRRSPSHPAVSADAGVLELEKDAEPEEAGEEEVSRTRLIAQNLPWTCTVEDVRSLFEKHGGVVDVELSMYSKTRNRGLAFVEMGSAEEALQALNALEACEFEGRALKIEYAKSKKKKPRPPAQPMPAPTFNLFISNISYAARAKDLREFFISEGGNVTSADIIFHDDPRRSTGYGFVAFKSKKDAEAALSSFQGKIFMGRPLKVARSKQFVKVQTNESLPPEDKPSESLSEAQQAEETDQS